MVYTPQGIPPTNVEQLAAFLQRELQRLAEEAASGPDRIMLQTLHVVPPRPREGMIVLADGTDWNPGSGAGFYGYRGGAWHLLG